MAVSAGIHHITAICRDPKANRAFYAGKLGLRMVKKTVNFDDPTTWHLYYGDEAGHPGTALTFFAWGDVTLGRNGLGMAVETAFAIPEGSFGYWTARLVELDIPHDAPEKRFGETVMRFVDPDGMRLALVAVKGAAALPAGWSDGPVPAEHALRGFHSVTLLVDASEPTAQVLTSAFGFGPGARDGSLQRFTTSGAGTGTVVDVRSAPGFLSGRQGGGSVHHVAFRASDDLSQTEMAAAVKALQLNPTDQIDQQYFRSVYVREPGGILFEIATDAPGFTVDEPPETLGSEIKLPPRLEAQRAEIVAALPPLT
jgi:glyoxalase family protein